LKEGSIEKGKDKFFTRGKVRGGKKELPCEGEQPHTDLEKIFTIRMLGAFDEEEVFEIFGGKGMRLAEQKREVSEKPFFISRDNISAGEDHS